MTSFARFQAHRRIVIQPLLARWPATAKTLHVSGFTAEGDLPLRIGPAQFAPKQGVVRCRIDWREINPTAGKVRMFAEHHAQQPYDRRLRNGSGVHFLSDWLRSPRDQIDMKFL